MSLPVCAPFCARLGPGCPASPMRSPTYHAGGTSAPSALPTTAPLGLSFALDSMRWGSPSCRHVASCPLWSPPCLARVVPACVVVSQIEPPASWLTITMVHIILRRCRRSAACSRAVGLTRRTPRPLQLRLMPMAMRRWRSPSLRARTHPAATADSLRITFTHWRLRIGLGVSHAAQFLTIAQIPSSSNAHPAVRRPCQNTRIQVPGVSVFTASHSAV